MANNTIQIKRTSVTGRAANSTTLTNAGELALNMVDGIMYSTNGTTVFEVGANLTNARITSGLVLDNDKRIYFRTKNTAANAMFVQQVDDNFVFYSTNSTYQPRPVWSIFANSDSSNLSFSVPIVFNTNVYLGTATLIANSSAGTSGQVLTSNGTSTFWSTPGAASVNTSAQFTWTNTHIFQANVTFAGNSISVQSNTGYVMFGGNTDLNWRIGRNTGTVSKYFYTNNTLDIIAAGSPLEGLAIGQPGANSYLETGYAGTFTRLPIYVGNSTVNSTINVSSYSIGASFVANTAGVYAGVVNGSSIQVGTSFTANATLVNAAAINVVGQTNSATLFVTTSANIGTVLVANASGVIANSTAFIVSNATGGQSVIANGSGVYVGNSTGVVNAASHTVGTSIVANTIGITLASNVDFLGDFSNSTIVSRSNFQTTVTDGTTGIYALPNGTSGGASWQAANSSNPTNASKILIATNGSTDVQLVSGINGTGTYLPLSFLTANTVQMQLDNSGRLTVGNSTVNSVISNSTLQVGTSFIANSTQVTITGVPLSANSTTGTSGQVLTSNGTTGAPYWATATATVNVAAQFAWTNVHTFAANVTVGNSTTNSAFLISQFGMSNPNTFTMGTVTTNAALNTVIAGPYTIATGNTLTITTGSRVVIV